MSSPAFKKEKIRGKLRSSSLEILRIAGCRGAAADIFLLSNREMKKLKKKFLPREKGPADILSFTEPFNWPHPERPKKSLGEIYLNWDLNGDNLNKLTYLLAHGILHLLGYDHKGKDDTIKMERLEKRISKSLNLCPI